MYFQFYILCCKAMSDDKQIRPVNNGFNTIKRNNYKTFVLILIVHSAYHHQNMTSSKYMCCIQTSSFTTVRKAYVYYSVSVKKQEKIRVSEFTLSTHDVNQLDHASER